MECNNIVQEWLWSGAAKIICFAMGIFHSFLLALLLWKVFEIENLDCLILQTTALKSISPMSRSLTKQKESEDLMEILITMQPVV